jgi:DNA-binding CsgD family transcriptional regulator
MGINLDDLKRLTTLAYSAALAPEKWQLVLDAMTEISGGARTHLFGFDLEASTSVVSGYSGYDPDFLPAYDDYFHQKNVWAEGFVNAEVGVSVPSEWMCSRENLYRSEFYNDWVRPQEDILGGGGALLFKEDKRMFAFGGNIRRRDVDRLEGPWLQLVGELVPHFQQAFEISRMLAGLTLEKRAIMLASDPENAACIVINDRRRIIHADANATAMLEDGGLVRRDVSHRLVFADWQTDRQFETALRAVDKSETHCPRSLEVQDGPGGEPLACRIAHLEPDRLDYSPFGILLGNTERCFLIALSGERRRESKDEAIRDRYGLTGQETNVVLQVAEGLTLREIAELREVSIHTVRNQIKSAMSKMDARRQSDLVRIVERTLGA